MKPVIIILFVLFHLCVYSQNSIEYQDSAQWKAPYYLPTPLNWTTEQFLIPIFFAPQIRYQGIEDIRFAPGWGNDHSNEYWSYAFLWYLDGYEKIDAGILKKNLKAYYSGLVDVMKNDSASDQQVPIKITVHNIQTNNKNLKQFSGSIYMFDYMASKPITLLYKVNIQTSSVKNKTYVFYEISPQPYDHEIWKTLDQICAEWKDEAQTE